MELQNEKAKLEKAIQLIELVELCESSIKEIKENKFSQAHIRGASERDHKEIQSYKSQIKTLERSYNRLMCIDELTELRKFKQERTGIVESLRCE